MTRDEASEEIPKLIRKWVKDNNIDLDEPPEPSFYAFAAWLQIEGFGQYLVFNSELGGIVEVRDWFENELRLGWRC